MLQKFNLFISTNKDLIAMWQKLCILDPRNLANLEEKSWASYVHMFGPKPVDADDDEDAKKVQASLVAHLESEWGRYCQVCAIRSELMYACNCYHIR